MGLSWFIGLGRRLEDVERMRADDVTRGRRMDCGGVDRGTETEKRRSVRLGNRV